MNHRKVEAIVRAIEDREYERSHGGVLFLPKERLKAIGAFHVSVNDGPVEITRNLVPDAMLTQIIGNALLGVSQISAWFIGLIGANVTPAAGWTGANFTANATEFTNYTEGNRQTWTGVAGVAGSAGNLAAKAAFTIGSGGALTVYGGALLSSNVKSGTSGILAAATKFTTARVLQTTDVLNIGYTIAVAAA